MATLTLDRVLTDAEALPADEQEMLEGLLRQRRIEAWRRETAAAAKEAGDSTAPVTLQNKWQGQVLIPIGKATTVFSSDYTQSKGSMRLVVTATLLQ